MSSTENNSQTSEFKDIIKEHSKIDKGASHSSKTDVGQEETESPESTKCVTMVDVLQDKKDLEEDARAVLGAADDRNCTYNEPQTVGYLKRQAIYSCLTCSVPNDPSYCPAGICLACSYACHNDHTLVELYTKRRFRCDCGNSKFPKNNPCKLYANKEPENHKNLYNQNFRGVYCTCHRPYPDEEDTVADAMIQCALCEDWYHRRHLQVNEQLPCQSTFSEMICYECCKRYHESFLFGYRGYSTESTSEEDSTDSFEDDISTTENIDSSIKENIFPDLPVTNITPPRGEKEKGTDNVKCFLEEESVEKMKSMQPSTLFMVAGWRDRLCRCEKCIDIYQNFSLEYLLDEEDTLDYYENASGSSDNSEEDMTMKAMSGMDRTQQIEALHGYNTMKNNLTEYLKKFVENKTVVREEDIQEFFQGLSARKKMKVSPPDNCK